MIRILVIDACHVIQPRTESGWLDRFPSSFSEFTRLVLLEKRQMLVFVCWVGLFATDISFTVVLGL